MMKRKKIRALGQHFLKNPHVQRKIIQAIAPSKDELIVEIGAGKGALTFQLAEKAGKVIAIEKEKAFVPLLKEKKMPNLEVLEKNVLRVSFTELLQVEKFPPEKIKIVGNLPYSISTPLLFKILEEKNSFSECVFLLQKEVAERICGQPHSKNYAPLSILFQLHFEPKILFSVSPRSFSPPPKVESGLISLKKRSQPLFSIDDEFLFYKFLRASFQQRRKTLFNNLKILNLPQDRLKEAFQSCQVEKHSRGEELDISTFIQLYNFLF